MKLIPYLTSQTLNEIDYLNHGFFSSIGGVSKGCYATLNTSLKDGDDSNSVYENRSRICRVFNLSLHDLCVVNQNHTDIVHFVSEPFHKDNIPIGDALITITPGVLLGIKTADCVPILLADKNIQIIAIIHAGWRGAVGKIIENTVNIMKEKGAKNLVAALGPCIWQDSFEVDKNFFDNINNGKFFKNGKDENSYYFDLEGYVINRLKMLGVKYISSSYIDTFVDKRFFSFRRKTVENKNDTGNQMSVIYIHK